MFAAGKPIGVAQEFYADVKARTRAAERDPAHLKILPGALVIVGESMAEANAKKQLLDSLVHPDSGMAALSIALGTDASGFDLNAPLPPTPETNASKSARERVLDIAARNNFTVGQLAQYLGGYGGLQFVGTPASIADEMQAWLEGDACDGFNIMFPTLPAGLDEFVDMVVPELQGSWLFRKDYEGTTLRQHLGLPRPPNRFFAA